MGKGVVIDLSDGELVLLVDVIVLVFFFMKYVIGLLILEGVEFFIYIGMDIVNLEGKGFIFYVV